MKKLYLILCAALAISACGKIAPDGETPASPASIQNLVFDFTVNYPGETKAVKSGWEEGDKVFVFFQNVTTGYVTLTYGASGWSEPAFDGTASVTDLQSGRKLTAIYLPFCNDATATYNEGWSFSTAFYSYYMCAEQVQYTVTKDDGITSLKATLDMVNPDGFVQFFIEDESATNGNYYLGCDAIIPVGLASISSDYVKITEKSLTAKDILPGYAYKGGYLFSGKIDPSYAYGSNYYFFKTKLSDASRADYFVSGKTLTSHSAVKLPGNSDARWIPVGEDKTVNLGSLGVWYTCNYGASVPEDFGTPLTWNRAMEIAGEYSSNKSLPSFEYEFNEFNSHESTFITVNGQKGLVVKGDSHSDTPANGFIFLPSKADAMYWASTEDSEDDSSAYCLDFDENSFYVAGRADKTQVNYIRYTI